MTFIEKSHVLLDFIAGAGYQMALTALFVPAEPAQGSPPAPGPHASPGAGKLQLPTGWLSHEPCSAGPSLLNCPGPVFLQVHGAGAVLTCPWLPCS